MKIRFWGTRGSIPAPGFSTVRYGGNTSCVEVRTSKDTLIILDCGSGLRLLGEMLMSQEKQPVRGYILLSHTHWDHIQGLPFFTPLFVPGNEWDIYAPRGFEQSLRETLAGQMQYTYFPVTLANLGSHIKYHQLMEGEFQIEDVKIQTHYLNHTALTLGYRLEADGVSVVYATDHEPHTQLAATKGIINEQEKDHIKFLKDADLVIHDSQYLAKEYNEKKGWGHSTVEYVVEICRNARVGKVAFTHHDPLRDDDAIDQLVERARQSLKEQGSSMEVFAAAEGQVLEMQNIGKKSSEHVSGDVSALAPAKPAVANQCVLLGISDVATATILLEAVRANGIQAIIKNDGESALRSAIENPPSLVILERDLPGIKGVDVCKEIRSHNDKFEPDLPIILLTSNEEDVGTGTEEGISDWLVKPFSALYARARIHALLLRTTLRWARPPIPKDEERRLEIMHRLNILDSEPEERFDRLTRLASALFKMPIVFITLMDRNRQWFKSCAGLPDIHETTRESSFCAHTIMKNTPMIICDTFNDDRFADNPLVTAEPYIRFYGGQPLVLPDGTCIGTLCLIDTRPRQLDEISLKLLEDLGDLVIRELLLPSHAIINVEQLVPREPADRTS